MSVLYPFTPRASVAPGERHRSAIVALYRTHDFARNNAAYGVWKWVFWMGLMPVEQEVPGSSPGVGNCNWVFHSGLRQIAGIVLQGRMVGATPVPRFAEIAYTRFG